MLASTSAKPKKLKKPKSNDGHQTAPNALDSTAPSRMRGKEKVNPQERMTKMKKIIVKEKQNVDAGKESDASLSVVDLTKRRMHDDKFRDYCQQLVTEDINDLIKVILTDLVTFQDRMHVKNPIKARVKKRLSFGFREISKYAKINKVKAVVLAPDIEKIESPGGLDDVVETLLDSAKANEIPVIIGLNRRKLGVVCKKKGKVSCVGILDYDGVQDKFKKLLLMTQEAQNLYSSAFEHVMGKLKSETGKYSDSQLCDEMTCILNELSMEEKPTAGKTEITSSQIKEAL